MGPGVEDRRGGCGQSALIVLMLLWLGAAPAATMLATEAVVGQFGGRTLVAAVSIAAMGIALILPFTLLALYTRRRAGWEAAAATAASLLAISGYLVVDATVSALFPEGTRPPLDGEGVWAGVLRLGLLVPYALLMSWLTPHLAVAPARRQCAWLGLSRFSLPPLTLGLALAALVAVPWPLTGALGDSLTSLSLALQTIARTVPQMLVFWGLVFTILSSAYERRWVAALTTALTYGLAAMGGVVPAARWGALEGGLALLPFALLLTELRARESGIAPLVPTAFCYHAAPLLFVDPRTVIAQGIPEPQHLVARASVVALATVAAVALWGERRVRMARLVRLSVPRPVRVGLALCAAAAAWGIWGGLYAIAGEPGFTNDGFLIILEEQADLGAAYDVFGRSDRLQYVYDTLVETAERTQAPLREALDELGVDYRPYYLVNMIRVDGHRWLARRFEGHPGVAQVILNPAVRVYPRRISLPYGADALPLQAVQSNLAAIHADEAWALGVEGKGIVVAGQDTGYDWTHPALKERYRGWDGEYANHDYNWHDAWDDRAVPFDDDSHGTHTMGTVLGDDGGSNRTGVAPRASWIGCRNMRQGFGNPAVYVECAEFFLAPYPHGGDPFEDGDVGRAPHVVGNSWSCPDFEGCSSDTLEPALDALRAAGIMMVVSVGNDGPACSTAGVPPANYKASFSVGASDEAGRIVGFSSRGPAGGLVKPDIVAPGEMVRSSVPGGAYGYAGGTSMAGPHVAGVVALLWSADPTLIGDIEGTAALLCQTAVPRPVENVCTAEDVVGEGVLVSLFSNPVCACGDVTGVPNNVYGCGLVDAGAAVRAVLAR